MNNKIKQIGAITLSATMLLLAMAACKKNADNTKPVANNSNNHQQTTQDTEYTASSQVITIETPNGTTSIVTQEGVSDWGEENGTAVTPSTGNQQTDGQQTVNQQTGNQQTVNQQTGNQQTGNQQTGNQQTGNQQTGNQQTGNQQTGNQQTGNQQTGNQQTGNQQTGNQQTGNQQGGNQQTGNQQTDGQQGGSQDVSGNKVLTIEEYEALTTSQQQAYFQSFPTVDAFYEWLEAAEAEREKNQNSVTGDGKLDLNDYINGKR